MNTIDLKTTFVKHTAWIAGDPDGERADLSGADLRNANLRNANLSGANLSGANLSENRGVIFADCTWTGHGERGRRLTVAVIDGNPVYFCGCFRGSEEELAAYIANGAEQHRESRTKAFDFVTSCL